MPLLDITPDPVESYSSKPTSITAIDSLLEKKGIIQKRRSAQEFLDKYNGNIEQLCMGLVNIANFGETHAVRLKAIEKCLEIHDVTTQKEVSDKPNITIVVQGDGGKVANIFAPREIE